MSADASRRVGTLAPPWLRYGLIAGIVAFGGTLAANLAVTWVSPADLCRVGLIVPLLSLGAFVVFLVMAAAAGFKTARAGAPAPDPTLAGLLVGVLAGCALVVLFPFVSSAEHRFQEVAAVCSGPVSSGGGSFSFNVGPTPPAECRRHRGATDGNGFHDPHRNRRRDRRRNNRRSGGHGGASASPGERP